MVFFVVSVSPAKSFSTSGDGKNMFLFEKGSVLKVDTSFFYIYKWYFGQLVTLISH